MSNNNHLWAFLVIALIAGVSIGFVVSNSEMTGNVPLSFTKTPVKIAANTTNQTNISSVKITAIPSTSAVTSIFTGKLSTYGLTGTEYGHLDNWFKAYNNMFTAAYESYKQAKWDDSKAFELALGYTNAAWQSGVGEVKTRQANSDSTKVNTQAALSDTGAVYDGGGVVSDSTGTSDKCSGTTSDSFSESQSACKLYCQGWCQGKQEGANVNNPLTCGCNINYNNGLCTCSLSRA